ncbi:MAG TPA: RNA 2',3'-cyclic phosphodiesterase [Pirellulales bacterium]|jgi:2'-5' RNA ligase|nr:RNA 2',3'-cyclic phosphodiesterase [Pirellulales bacterium]
MSRTVRTFVAVEMSPEVMARAGELTRVLARAEAPVKWVEPRHMHLTLKFLGEIDILEVPDVCNAVAAAVEPLPPFEFMAVGSGAFPDARRPRTVWLGVGAGNDGLITLHDAIEDALRALGFRSEQRRFHPHLTLGRVRGNDPAGIGRLAAAIDQQREFAGGVSDVAEVVVMSSTLGREGPTHEPLSHAELRGR